MDTDVGKLVMDNIRKRTEGGSTAASLQVETLLRELPLDSLAVLELVYELEEKYRVIVAEERLLALRTIGDIISMLEHALQERAED